MKRWFAALAGVAALVAVPATGAIAQSKKPNILVIWGGDVGWFNTSAYNSGLMGYQTPNIDRIAKEGARFTDWYAQQRCTAGRVIKPGSIFNGVASHEDMLPTLLAAVGEPDIVERCKQGCTASDETKVHLDGYDLQPWLKGDVAESPRKEFLYWNDDGGLVALRYDQWKLVFQEQRAMKQGWVVIRMKKDWKRIFAFE